ncbi:CTF18 [Blepharisma stoltei]|uniref:AAA+ ATPase domain-containing protein n=1 Tax=Blepharisma stoltei TaxID=1481888 RepID=A0AAU9JLM4_9CILI|nr:unnamed protein product [Blepharisma stoltei]
MEQHFSEAPTENSVPIVMYENVSDDFTINRQYFLKKASTNPFNTDLMFELSGKSFLEVPISRLKEIISENIQLKSAMAASKNESGLNFLALLDKEDRSLWMDKYEAHSFLELITEEYINRDSLSWLKSWDKAVFKEKRTPVKRGPFMKPKIESNEKTKPMLLIGGPPGCGKSTLARVITRQCNYQPYEVNCALIGVGKDLVQRVRNVLNIKTVTEKPLLLILDQVETLDKQTVQELNAIISVNTKRPIIAITNDIYAPSLKLLRPTCKIVNCKSLFHKEVFERLKEICREERVHLESQYLNTLIQDNNADIRTCLNTLQLLGSQREGSQFNVYSSDSDSFRSKFVNRSIFDIWKIIFTQKNTNGLRKIVNSFGDFELINSGIFENYTGSKYTDYSMDKSAELMDSLVLADVISQRISQKQEFELMPFQCMPSLTANKICTSMSPEIHFPLYFKQINKAITETTDAIRYLENNQPRKPEKLPSSVACEDIYSFITKIFQSSSGNDDFDYEILKLLQDLFREFGFEVINGNVEPSVQRIVRIPKDFYISRTLVNNFNRTAQVTKTVISQVKEMTYQDFENRKRKRESLGGQSLAFIYHDGLTNAVKKKVRISDLMKK